MDRSAVTETPKAADLIADDIRHRIVSHELQPGDNLPMEAELASTYGVSRPTMREALRLLEAGGLITIRRGGRSGPEVQRPDLRSPARALAVFLQYEAVSIEDVWSAQVAIECAVLTEVVARPSDVDLQPLRDLVAQLPALRDKPAEHAGVSRSFREELVRLSENRTLLMLTRMLRHVIDQQSETVVQQLDPAHLSKLMQGAAEAYTQLLDMIAQGDMGAAEFWRGYMARVGSAIFAELDIPSVAELFAPPETAAETHPDDGHGSRSAGEAAK